MLMKRLPVLLLFWCTWHCKTTTAQEKEECKDKLDYCNLIKSFCTSASHMEYAHANCPVTCKVCPKDIDPDGLCETDNGGCDHHCKVEDKKNKKCTCFPGYKLQDDGKTCEDIDECQFITCAKTKKYCSNTRGSYTCSNVSCDSKANEEPYMGRAECCQREPEDAECGVIGVLKSEPGKRILGGKDAYLGQWPWQVLIYIDGTSLCGGTLLNREWVVTAAHCFKEFKKSSTIDLYFGVWKLKGLRRKKHIQRRAMKKRVLYPGWKKDRFEINDIALVQLDKPVKYTQYVRPVCLPNGEKPKVGTTCFAAGWGLTDEENDAPSTTLQYVDLPLIDREKCERNYRNETTKVNKEFMTCAGYDEGGKDACTGDSGGPLVCQRCDSCGWFLAGIVSFGSGCGRKNLFGVYTDVPYYEDWISSQTSIHVTKDRSCSAPYLTQWANWADCTKTCGQGGQQTRTRECIHRGLVSDACDGPRTQTEDCSITKCPALGKWGQWADCSTTCGSGERIRLRDCLNGKLGQDGCPEDKATDSESCNMQECPFFSSWSAWGDCSASCGGGTQESTRSCQNGKVGDEGCVGATKQSQDCATNKCIVFGEWTKWTDCSLSCGGGEQSRTRECLHTTNPSDCDGEAIQRRKCNEQTCSGKWTSWSDWSTCDATCGKGETKRSRDCQGGEVGKPGCDDGEWEQTKECEEKPCPSRWGDWTSWTSCSKTCDRGLQTRTRACVGSGGCAPESDSKEEKLCNEVICIECFDWDESYCDNTFGTPRACEDNIDFAQLYCPAQCNLCPSLFEHWNQWGPCSGTCGKGVRERTRDCNNLKAGCDGSDSEVEECQASCKGFLPWSKWTKCTATCNGGKRTRSRSCPFKKCDPDENGSSALTEEKDCGQTACPGKWGKWEKWSACSVTCGDDGLEERTRECAGGRPGGPGCLGSDKQTRACTNTPACPARWTEWGDWTDCSVSCGPGRRERTRRCENGIPGRLGCEGSASESDDCDAGECVATWGEWGEWGQCDSSCVRQRERKCSGGRTGDNGCKGEDSQTETCDASLCGAVDPCDDFLFDFDSQCESHQSTQKHFCRTRQGEQQCAKTCCEALKHLPCEDDPQNAATYCLPQYLQYCRDPRYQETIYKPYCAKSCGFC